MRVFGHASNVLQSQWHMAKTFYGNPVTKTPILIIWVASFGGALHASVTTYYYLEVGSSDLDIGRIGFIQCLGSLLFAPLAGYALDHGVPVFLPLMVTATACSAGCLWRGLAHSVSELYWSAGVLSVGVNLWVVVLLHLTHCTPRDTRSHVLSGFSVQETGLRLLGKILFPLWDYLVRLALRGIPEFNTTLFRYRIHMGICTLFCFFGTVALVVDRRALEQLSMQLQSKEGQVNNVSLRLQASPMKHSKIPTTPTSIEVEIPSPDNTPTKPTMAVHGYQTTFHISPPHTSMRFRYVAILTSLLIQSWSSTVLTVLWPLVLRDQFRFAATEYGIVAVMASICSTLSIASFPTLEMHLGRFRTAASSSTLASLGCALAFVILPNIMSRDNNDALAKAQEEAMINPDAVTINDNSQQHALATMCQQRFLLHAVVAIVFQASVQTLEPSLKSIFSLTVPASLQNRSLGFMSTLGGLGGMGGNILGTWMFQYSKRWSKNDGRFQWLANGAMPFASVSAVLALASLFLWTIEWEETTYHRLAGKALNATSDQSIICEENGQYPINTASPNATASLDMMDEDGRLFYPLLQLDTTYQTKLD